MNNGAFTIHTGKRKRPMRGRQIERLKGRNQGTQKERDAARNFFAPSRPICRDCADSLDGFCTNEPGRRCGA